MQRGWMALVLCLSLCGAAWAQEVNETLPNGTKVSASYLPAAPGAPALLLLHGFLVTEQFPVVQSLAEFLAGKGYAVLAPTLSLGLNHRRAGLACDAIHTHTQTQDQAEIAFWVNWLVKRGAQQIVLVGHSFGSTQLLDYLSRDPAPQVVGLIGMSLSYVGAVSEELQPAELKRAQQRVDSGDASLARYKLIYCRGNYTSTAESYLSYAALQRSRVLQLARDAKRPRVAIMGGADQRFGADWVNEMQQAGVVVTVVPGASHFFDGSFEFDLQDAVLNSLQALKVRP